MDSELYGRNRSGRARSRASRGPVATSRASASSATRGAATAATPPTMNARRSITRSPIPRKQRRRDREAEGLGLVEVDDELVHHSIT